MLNDRIEEKFIRSLSTKDLDLFRYLFSPPSSGTRHSCSLVLSSLVVWPGLVGAVVW